MNCYYVTGFSKDETEHCEFILWEENSSFAKHLARQTIQKYFFELGRIEIKKIEVYKGKILAF